MKYDAGDICKEYYESVKHLYPELNYAEFKEIAYRPWEDARKHIASGQMKTIRLQFFGTFVVYTSKVKKELGKLEYRFTNGIIVEKVYTRLKKAIVEFLNKRESEEKN